MNKEYKIGDKVFFIKQPNKSYAWLLNDYEEYTICNSSYELIDIIDGVKDVYKNVVIKKYGVKNKKGNIETTWFDANDFITLKEYRKIKIKNLMKL